MTSGYVKSQPASSFAREKQIRVNVTVQHQTIFITQGLGRKQLDQNIGLSFDDILENDPGRPFFRTLPGCRTNMTEFDRRCHHGRCRKNSDHQNST
jgi:hypothetical protein